MSAENAPPTEYEQIDLSWWVGALVRGKWIILAFVLASAAAGGIINFAALSPSYQASAVVGLPPADEMNGLGMIPGQHLISGLGMSPSQHLQFATSDPVIEDLRQALGSESSADGLRMKYRVRLTDDRKALSVSASDAGPEQAVRLVDQWIAAYDRQLRAAVRNQFDLPVEEARRRVDLTLAQLDEANKAWDAFRATDGNNLLAVQLASLERSLADDKARTGDLLQSLIPGNETKLALQQKTLDRMLENAGMPEVNSSAGTSAVAGYIDRSKRALGFKNRTINSRLAGLENELIDNERRLRELVTISIPNNEAKLAYLVERLPAIPETISGHLQPYADSSGEAAAVAIPGANPVFLQLSQEIEDTRILLEVQRREALSLEAANSSLRGEIERTGRELLISQRRFDLLAQMLVFVREIERTETALAGQRIEAGTLEAAIDSQEEQLLGLRRKSVAISSKRDELFWQRKELRDNHTAAKDAVARLLEIEPGVHTFSALNIVRNPSLPQSPVSPRKTRNIVIAGVVGIILGVSVTLFLEFYRGGWFFQSNPARRNKD